MGNQSTKGMSKEKLASFLALLSFTAYMPVSCLPSFAADITSTTLPDLNSAVNGSVSTSGTTMNVAVEGSKGTVGQFDWNTFNVGSDATVNWVFSANSQTALNRVLASGGMSYIYGKLTESSSTGCTACTNTSKVILINPSGILFGNGSSVDLNSFTASTYDIKGAKDLKDLSDSDLATYAGTGGTTGTLFDIAGYNKTVSFVANDNMVDGDGYITSDATGTRLASIVADGATIEANKSIAFISNKIDINDSTLTTTYSSTPNASNYTQTKSNIKLVTADGVNFYYTSAGNIDNSVSVSKTTTDQTSDYGISITDSEIRSGNFLAYNGAEEGSIDISGSTIYTKKLLGTSYTSSSGTEYDETETGTDGNLVIQSSGTVNIDSSNIQTTNDTADGASDIGYGNMTISGSQGVNISNTTLRTADSTVNTDSDNITAGNITIKSSEGDVTITQDSDAGNYSYSNTAIASAGDLTITAAGDVTIDGYDKIQATGNSISSTSDRTITVSGTNVNFEETLLNAKNLAVSAAEAIDVVNTSIVADNTSLIGSDTTIDGSLLQYKELTFYDSDDQLNNVTITNNSTFNDTDSDTLTIATNGNLTLDNENIKKQTYGSTSSSYAQSVELVSTQGDVSIQNGSTVRSKSGDVDITAENGAISVTDDSFIYANSGSTTLSAKDNIAIDGSTVWAKDGDMNITSSEGKVTATDSYVAAEGGDTTISQALSMNIDEDFNGSMIGATNKLTLKTDADITGSTLASGTGYINDYTDLVSLNNNSEDIHFIFAGAELNAGGDITVTDLQSATNVDFVAGDSIDLDSTGDMTLTNVSTSAGDTTDITAADDLVLNGFEIVAGTKTTLEGSTVTTADDTTIDTNENKLAVNADTTIDIAVTGVTSAENGLEINADVNTSSGSDPLEGKDVSVTAADGTLAISKIKADTLNLTADTIIAGTTTISSDTDNVSGLDEAGVSYDSKAYIEVRTDGGFNLDPTTTYSDSNSSIYTGGDYGNVVTGTTTTLGDEYTESTSSSEVTTSTELVSSEEVVTDTILNTTETSRVQSGDSTVETTVTYGDDGYTTTTTTTTVYDVTEDVEYQTNTVNTYQDYETTTTTTSTTTYQDYETTTTSRDQQHIATLNEDEQNAFVLVYGKTSSDTVSGTNDLGTTTTTNVSTVESGSTYTETVEGTGSTVVQNTYQDTVVTTSSVFCENEEEVTPDTGVEPVIEETTTTTTDTASTYVRNPRHAEGTSDTADVQNDLADTSSTVVAAAARLELDDEASESDDDDSDLLIE